MNENDSCRNHFLMILPIIAKFTSGTSQEFEDCVKKLYGDNICGGSDAATDVSHKLLLGIEDMRSSRKRLKSFNAQITVGDNEVSCSKNADDIKSLHEEFNSRFADILKENEALTANLQESFKGVEEDLKKARALIERMEQYGRRMILELHGVRQEKDENTNEIAKKIFHDMGIRVSDRDIDRSHRNPGQKTKGLPAPILVKFIRHDLKEEIFSKREVLRDLSGYKKTYINENLTVPRRKLFAKVRKMQGWESWTWDGVIYVQKYNYVRSKIYRITCVEDFNKFRDNCMH